MSPSYIPPNAEESREDRRYAQAWQDLRRELGFTVTDSKANFLFAAHPTVSGEALYQGLRARGILVRHFSTPAIANYNRITVGTDAEMDALIAAIREIL